ncbi:MAG: hypothetical protein QJR13_00105 [Bacillota bacterium]|nr:hypothetical protein [Bacillota bacterium]
MRTRVRIFMAASLLGLAFLFFAAASHLLLGLASREQSRMDLAALASRELTRALGLPVKVEGVEPGLFQVVVLRHLTLGSTAAGRPPFFAAPRVELGYSLWRLLTHPGHPEAALTYISVWDPELNLSAQEAAQLSARFSAEAGGRGNLRLWLNLLRGKASFSGEGGEVVHLEGIRGRMQLDGHSWRVAWLEGRWREGKSPWALEGKIVPAPRPLLDLRLRLPSLDLSAGERLPLPPQWRGWWSGLKPRGVVDLEVEVKGEPKQPLVVGLARLNGVALSLNRGVRLEDLTGQVEVAGEKISTKGLRFRWAEGQGRLSGELAGWERPRLAVRLQLAGVSLRSRAVQALFPRPEWPEALRVGWRKTDGRLTLHGLASGPVDDLVLSGSLTWEGRELFGLPWRQAEAAVEYAGCGPSAAWPSAAQPVTPPGKGWWAAGGTPGPLRGSSGCRGWIWPPSPAPSGTPDWPGFLSAKGSWRAGWSGPGEGGDESRSGSPETWRCKGLRSGIGKQTGWRPALCWQGASGTSTSSKSSGGVLWL